MSTASRLAAAAGSRIASSAPQLGLNSAGVPGGLGADPLPDPFVMHGVTWAPDDAAPHASPIGYALASTTTPTEEPT